MLLTITVLCYMLSLFCGSGIELSVLTIEQWGELSRWEKVQDAWGRVRFLPVVGKMGVMFLWGVLVWFSGILSQEDKALAIQIVKRGLQKLRP